VVVPKTEEQRGRIEQAVKNNFLFRGLDEEQHGDVVNAMVERKVESGEVRTRSHSEYRSEERAAEVTSV
jgi:hypothetical protein